MHQIYSTSGSSYGNKLLTNPIGLVSADELMYSGMVQVSAPSNYLVSVNDYWTMTSSIIEHFKYGGTIYYRGNHNAVIYQSPRQWNSDFSWIGWEGIYNMGVSATYNNWSQSNIFLRPVLNLKPTVNFSLTGSGTPGSATNPYIIQ